MYKIFRKNNKNINLQRGFTLIETMVAIFILTVAIQSFLTVISSSLFSSRYAKNEMTALYLAQEVVDTIRNDRDSIAFLQGPDLPTGWMTFLNKYGYYDESSKNICFLDDGCIMEPTLDYIYAGCTIDTCPYLIYDENAVNKDYYTYDTSVGGVPTIFRRQVFLSINENHIPDELDIKVIVTWKNGNLNKSMVLRSSLLAWRNESIVTTGGTTTGGEGGEVNGGTDTGRDGGGTTSDELSGGDGNIDLTTGGLEEATTGDGSLQASN